MVATCQSVRFEPAGLLIGESDRCVNGRKLKLRQGLRHVDYERA